jgi:type IV pilus assembly protein PilV
MFKPTIALKNLKTKGFSLLEILISVVVLSLGLLGVAALQTRSVGFVHSGELRSIASYQAYNMIDRIRANKAGRTAGSYASLTGEGSDPGCTTCTPAQIAQKDQFEWNNANATLLPLGQGTVTQTGNVYTITVHWDNHRSGATGTACSGDSAVDLSCIQVSTEL